MQAFATGGAAARLADVADVTIDAAPKADVQGPVIETEAVSRAFGGVVVLSDISLKFRPGEVHAVIGENGAGKSTLMKILAGHLQPTSGRVLIGGEPIELTGPAEAERRGIVLVHQEILLAPDLTVAQCMFLGRELTTRLGVDDRAMNAKAAAALARLGCHVPPTARVNSLSIANRQLVQIARALLTPHKAVIFDEPTASLTPVEAGALFQLIGELRQSGVAVVYISHRLEEVKAIADVVTVLRDGKWIATRPAASLQPVEMARLMVGRDLEALYPQRPAKRAGGPALSVEGFVVDGAPEAASFELRPGEILGLGGLVGAGRTELLEAVTALRKGAGRIRIGGADIAFRAPRDAMRAGVVYLTEDRKGKGLILAEPVAVNLTLAALSRFSRGFGVDRAKESAALDKAISDFDIRINDKAMLAGQLSGGNQQKLLLAKMMLLDPRIVIIDEPTRGVDVGAKQQIYQFIARLAGEGRAVIVISSEMNELIGLCHRVLVMRGGRIVGELEGADITEQNIVMRATGVSDAGAQAPDANIRDAHA